MTCSCCGRDRPTVAPASRPDVGLCRSCLESLLGRIGVTSTPTLPVVDVDEAAAFYGRAGFGVRIYEGDGSNGFAFVDLDGQSVFDLGAERGMDPDTNHAGCYLVAQHAEAWHARLAGAGLPVTPMADRPWGMREFTLTDPSGNRVRIGRPVSAAAAN